MKKISPIILVIAVFLWSFELYQPAKKSEQNEIVAQENQISGIMTAVDGDTLRAGKERIRLIKIDTPESKQECFDENNRKYLCGIMAKDFLIELIGKNEVTCKYQKRDMYNRYLAECFVNETSLNKELIRGGMAVVFSYSKFDEELKELQEEAKENKRGIWRGKFELPKDYRKRIKRGG